MKHQAEHIADRLADPTTRLLLRAAGYDVQDWDDTELATLACTARALRSGDRVFVPQAMEQLVSVLVRDNAQSKTAATPLRSR